MINPSSIGLKYLAQISSEYRAWRVGGHGTGAQRRKREKRKKTCFFEQRLENTYQGIIETLAKEFLEKIKNCSPEFFKIWCWFSGLR